MNERMKIFVGDLPDKAELGHKMFFFLLTKNCKAGESLEFCFFFYLFQLAFLEETLEFCLL